MRSLDRTLFVALLTSASLPAPASAAIICVNPAGGACETTIQAGVDAAGPGDTVKVAAGTYYETVTIGAGKNGLQLVGSGKLTTTIDADVPNSADAITVFSDDVQIRNLGIRNGQAAGVMLFGNATLVSGVRIVGLRGVNSSGIFCNGTDEHQILSNEIRSVRVIGIRLLSCPLSVVQGNLVAQSSSTGIYVTGADVQVTSNKVFGATGAGVFVFGPTPTVTGNQIEEISGGTGLYVEGDNPVVRANRLLRARNASVACATCASGIVEGNSVTGSPVEGLSVSAQAPGLVVRSNTVTNVVRAAFLVSGTGVIASLNRATDSGIFMEGDCYRVESGAGGHTLTSNLATRCGASGFHVAAPGVTLDRNTSTAAGWNGFTVSSGANGLLTGNIAQSSNAAGFAVTTASATGTTLTGNQGTKNRYDFCDDGVGTDTSGGNSFGSTSTVCDLTQ